MSQDNDGHHNNKNNNDDHHVNYADSNEIKTRVENIVKFITWESHDY